MKIENITNERGNKVANQIKVETDSATYFQSYESVIAKVEKNTKNVLLTQYWDYSPTTLRHLRTFLSDMGFEYGSKKEIAKAIEDGYIILLPFNSMKIS